MELEDLAIEVGTEMYAKAASLVQTSKGEDNKNYRCARLRLSDGRIIDYNFFDNIFSNSLSITNLKWVEELESEVGDLLSVYIENGKATVRITLCYLDNRTIRFAAGNETKNSLTKEQEEIIKDYLEIVQN